MRMGLSNPYQVKTTKAEPRVRKPRTRSGEHHTVVRIVRSCGNSPNAMRVFKTNVGELPELRCVAVEPLNLALADVGDGCRYIGGDDHLYCGHPAKSDSAYCVPHHALMFVPPQPRRDQRSKTLGTDFAKRSVWA
jgi:hypothetical protein